MADTAFDPYATPYGPPAPAPPDEPVETPVADVQVAQAPPQEPAPGEIREKAIIPGLPDRTPARPTAAPPAAQQPAAPAAPPPAPGTPSYVERPDDEDERDAKAARDAEIETFRNNLREHNAPYGRVTPPGVVDYRELPKWQELQALRQHYPNLTPKERNEAERAVKAEENRLITETKFKNQQAAKAYETKHRDDMAKIDAPRENAVSQQKTIEVMEGARQAREAELKAQLASNVPADKNKADYTMKVSPHGTMKPAEFTDAIAAIHTYNGQLTARQVLQYGTILGSPVNRNEKGELQPGANEVDGKKVVGKGATAYTVVGREGRANMLVRMPDGQVIRVPTTVYNQFSEARVKGYGEQRKWWAQRKQAFEDAAKDDWVTRQVKKVIPLVKERLQ